jgi:hypothetical protein
MIDNGPLSRMKNKIHKGSDDNMTEKSPGRGIPHHELVYMQDSHLTETISNAVASQSQKAT